MRKKILLLLTLVSLYSCEKNNKNTRNHAFNWVNTNSFIENQIPVIDENLITISLEEYVNDDKKINTSDIISDFSLLSLEDKNHQIGGVDKIMFNENYIFVLDQHSSNSLYIFNRADGKLLNAYNQHGQAPNEIGTIYDFDVDFNKKRVYIFDGENRKYMVFDFQGNFILYRKLPFRIDNVRKLPTGDFINFPKHSPNDHLGDFYKYKNIIIADSTLTPSFGAFDYDPKVIINDFYSRDYFGFNNNTLSFFPRYENDIYLLEKDKGYKFKKILTFDLGKFQLDEEDFVKQTEKFLSERREDGFPFGNGVHFISKRWVGASFKRFGKSDVDVFYNRESNQVYAGTGFNFSLKGMPFFAFPIDVNGEEGVSILDASTVRVFKGLTKEHRQVYRNEGLWGEELEEFVSKVDDVEAPVLIFYTLK